MSYVTKDGMADSFPNNRRNTSRSRNMTEVAFTRVTTNLVDVEGWVISTGLDERQNTYFEFCILGYYFKVSTSDLRALIQNDWMNVYATITIQDNELLGQNTTDGYNIEIYDGVNFTNTIPTSAEKELHTIRILEKVDGIWTVPESSKIKFNGDSLDLIVDGGFIGE